MNIIKELESLKAEVMAIPGGAIEGKIKSRNHIEKILKELKKEIEVPSWVTIQAKDIGADV